MLILIQLRRQSSSLLETIDACKAEQENMRNMGQQVKYFLSKYSKNIFLKNRRNNFDFIIQPSIDLRQHAWELEEQVARLNPVINLVDNMVKLGTLYRGSDNAPMSQRLKDMRQDAPTTSRKVS